MTNQDTNFEAAKNFVAMKRKQKEESLSGPGSWEANTAEVVPFIEQVLQDHDIRHVLDLGCGDWNWFRKVNLSNTIYEGWDADHEMIKQNMQSYGTDEVIFRESDIVLEEYPKTDLIICRDVLFHMDQAVAQTVIRKIQKSTRFLISTSFRDSESNTNPQKFSSLENWWFYAINLNDSPFDLKKYEILYEEEKRNQFKENKRYISLFDFGENN